jgi:hypothetical protein
MATAAQPLESSEASQRTAWSPARRALFRFGFCYFVLYSLPESGRFSVISFIPGGETISNLYSRPWHWLCPWVAIHLFHLSGERTTYFPTGSGDTTLQYITNLH